MCEVLQVSRAGYYAWLRYEPSQTQLRREKLLQAIKQIHLDVSPDYGSPRVHRELVSRGIVCSENTVAKIMQQEGIQARSKRKFRVSTTDSNHDLPIAPNRLKQRFEAERCDEVWLTDITYIATDEGFTYLCTVEDLYSRRIVGWAVSRQVNAKLAMDALQQAIDLRNPPAGMIVHSDRGSQFASLEYQQKLSEYQLLASMSGKGNCYDNAPMESFYRSFKVEEVYWSRYASHEEATRSVINYIDRFYNRIRLHSSIGYLSPIEFERTGVSESNC